MLNVFTGLTEQFRQMKRKRFFQLTFLFSVIFLVGSVALILLTLFPDIRTKDFVPLHYNIHFGVDLIGAWWRIFTAPAIGVIILVMNSVGALMIWRKERVISYFFFGIMLLTQIFLFIGVIFLVFLNTIYG